MIISTEIRFLGGTQEVGRIAVALKTGETQLLLDYGVMLGQHPGFPMHIPSKEVDCIILTHSHLDHSGAVPIFQIDGGKPVYGNRVTFELSQLLISDFIHLSGYYLPFEYLELRSMMKNSVHLDFRGKYDVGEASFQFLNAGHIPGSLQVLVEAGGKRILYTGDFNTSETMLLNGADLDYGELDAVIIESTYADEDHTERRTLEKAFVEKVSEVVEGGGTVLVPAFGVGRSQEIICVLSAYHFEHPITVDGMARETNRILMDHSQHLRDPKLFMDAMRTSTWVEGWRDRRKAAKQQGVIVSPAGMLKGGPAAFYISKIGKKAKNGVFLVSYQIPGTPGRELLEKGRCVVDGKLRRIKAQVEHFDFSSHAGASDLRNVIQTLKGNPKIYVVHGAEGNCTKFAEWIRENTGLEAYAPQSGEKFML